jgi:membrane protein YqaA with SNARE-associated domain
MAQQEFAADVFQRPLRFLFQAWLKPAVDMICMTSACAKMACKNRCLAQVLSKSSDFLISRKTNHRV